MTAEQLDEVRQKRRLILAERRKQNRMFKQKLDVRLVAEALCSFGTMATIAAETSSRQTLDRCTVPVIVCQRVALWDRMAQVYQTVMLAIAQSGVTVNNLQIYSGIQRCGVPALALSEHMQALEAANFSKAAKQIRSLSINIKSLKLPDIYPPSDSWGHFPQDLLRTAPALQRVALTDWSEEIVVDIPAKSEIESPH
ncbi:MAG: hypothetical protein Q9199_007367 [Rusavskia elegans]